MKFYRLINDSNNYYSVATVDKLSVDWPNQFNGKKFSDSWLPIRMCLDETETDLIYGDFSHFRAHLPVLTERAWNVLKSLIKEYVEVLPLELESKKNNERIFTMNVHCVLDALDADKSDISYFDEGDIMAIDHYIFNNEEIGSIPIFRIQGYEVGGVYVNNAFRRLVEKNKLRGLLWKDLL